jgi:succinate dehydrogenase / fumarate reductase cytochrome b subunit
LLSLWRTTVGKKIVMAATGLVLFAFVVVHMLGNLKIYQGAKAFNDYAGFLRSVGSPPFPHGAPLWIARVVLLGCAVLHVAAGLLLWRKSHLARPIDYSRRKNLEAGYSPPTMRWGGVFVGLFVIYHVLQFNFGVTGYGAGGTFDAENVYANVVMGFSLWSVSALYIAAMIALGLHIFHGFWSLTQTLGINDPRSSAFFRTISIAGAILVAGGYIAIPVSVLLGVLR